MPARVTRCAARQGPQVMTSFTAPLTASPLSFGQEQLWFLDQLTPGGTTYNILLPTDLRGPLRVDILQRCLTLLVERHEALRVTISAVDGTPFQVVTPPSEVDLAVIDHSADAPEAQQQAVGRSIRAWSELPFDLATGPLYRYRLLRPPPAHPVRLPPDHHVPLQNLHPIVTDGWSSAVMNADLTAAYRSLVGGDEPSFDSAGSRYTDFARAQRTSMQGTRLTEELDFWAERLAGLPVLEIPTDRPRGTSPSHPADSVIQTFPDELLAQVRALASGHGVSLFMVLAAALDV